MPTPTCSIAISFVPFVLVLLSSCGHPCTYRPDHHHAVEFRFGEPNS